MKKKHQMFFRSKFMLRNSSCSSNQKIWGSIILQCWWFLIVILLNNVSHSQIRVLIQLTGHVKSTHEFLTQNNVRLNYLRLPLLLCLIYDASLCCFNRKFTSLMLSHFLLIRCDGKHMNIPDWYCLTLCSLFYEAAFSLLMLFLKTLMVLFDTDNYFLSLFGTKRSPKLCLLNQQAQILMSGFTPF